MTKENIVSALCKALTDGAGSLDDLTDLLTRAMSDIETVKTEEKKKEQERGNKIADLANRLLNHTTTADDVAFVINEYCGPNSNMTNEDVTAAFNSGKELGELLFESILRPLLDKDAIKNFSKSL